MARAKRSERRSRAYTEGLKVRRRARARPASAVASNARNAASPAIWAGASDNALPRPSGARTLSRASKRSYSAAPASPGQSAARLRGT